MALWVAVNLRVLYILCVDFCHRTHRTTINCQFIKGFRARRLATGTVDRFKAFQCTVAVKPDVNEENDESSNLASTASDQQQSKRWCHTAAQYRTLAA